MTKKQRFLAACNGQPVDRPPVWIMRQAGRYLPEYQALRKQHSFKDFCQKAELAREVALQPLRRFELDAAILFSDILVIPEAMGIAVDYLDGGPQLSPRVECGADLARLVEPDVPKALGYVAEALEAIRDGIGDDMALIGFAGAPYTLASYMVGGSGNKRVSAVKLLAYRDPDVLARLMQMLAEVIVAYLDMQIAHGADVVQLFDTWAGELSPTMYRRLVFPYVRQVVDAMRERGVPLIYYINGSAGLLDEIAELKLGVFGVDWRQNLTTVRARLGADVALMGNLDPLALYGPEAALRLRVRQIASELGGRGHIMNLGHGIYPDAPISGVEAFVDEVITLELGQ